MSGTFVKRIELRTNMSSGQFLNQSSLIYLEGSDQRLTAMTNLTIRRFEFQYLAGGRVLLHLSSYLEEKGREMEGER